MVTRREVLAADAPQSFPPCINRHGDSSIGRSPCFVATSGRVRILRRPRCGMRQNADIATDPSAGCRANEGCSPMMEIGRSFGLVTLRGLAARQGVGPLSTPKPQNPVLKFSERPQADDRGLGSSRTQYVGDEDSTQRTAIAMARESTARAAAWRRCAAPAHCVPRASDAGTRLKPPRTLAPWHEAASQLLLSVMSLAYPSRERTPCAPGSCLFGLRSVARAYQRGLDHRRSTARRASIASGSLK